MKLRVEKVKKGSWDYFILNAAGVTVADSQPGSVPYFCGLLRERANLIDLYGVDQPSTLCAVGHATRRWVLVDEASRGVVSAPVRRYEDTVQTVTQAASVRSVMWMCDRHGAVEAAVAATARGTTTAAAASPLRRPPRPERAGAAAPPEDGRAH